MTSATVSAWLLIVFCFEFAVGLFLVFAERTTPWWKRLMAAPASLVLLATGIGLTHQVMNDKLESFEALEPKFMLFLFLFVNILGYRLVRHWTKRENRFSVFGTIGRGLGCVVAAWLGFAAVLLGIAALMGLVVWLSN